MARVKAEAPRVVLLEAAQGHSGDFGSACEGSSFSKLAAHLNSDTRCFEGLDDGALAQLGVARCPVLGCRRVLATVGRGAALKGHLEAVCVRDPAHVESPQTLRRREEANLAGLQRVWELHRRERALEWLFDNGTSKRFAVSSNL